MQKQLEVLAHSSGVWAIQSEAVLVALGVVAWQHDEWQAAAPSTLGGGSQKIAVIPVQGVLTKGGPSWLGSNYNRITEAVENATADANVSHIVLAFDSPGGDVTGLKETAAVVAQAAKQKPVTALVEGKAASAAYWLASQARDIVLTPSGEVGSVGVKMLHADRSEMMSKLGISVTELHAGEFKTEWSPFAPLTDAAKDNMQTRIDGEHREFISAVSTGRGSRATAEIQKREFGGGRMFGSTDALAHGLVDKVQSPRDFYRAAMPSPETENTLSRERARLGVERARF